MWGIHHEILPRRVRKEEADQGEALEQEFRKPSLRIPDAAFDLNQCRPLYPLGSRSSPDSGFSGRSGHPSYAGSAVLTRPHI
jgi:hypothetical protein